MFDETLKTNRFRRLMDNIGRQDLDAVALVPGANFYYLTGAHFHLMERPTLFIVARDGSRHAIIPALEKQRWATLAPETETIYWQDSDGYQNAFEALAARLGLRRVGVEGQRMRVFEAHALKDVYPDAAIVDAHADISAMRLCKDEAELAAMARAIEISEAGLQDTLAKVSVGMSETTVRQMLVAAMLDHGADGVGFDPLVLTGAAAADPHGTSASERRLEPGEALLIDFGAAWGGYCADITRTVFCRHVSSDRRAIYEAVQGANALGREVTAAGVTLDEIDRRVGNFLRDAGYGDLIVHKTGHGLGLDVHEAPQVMIGNMQKLEPGMVITIEPGLYRTGDVGVRIEDDVVATETGCRSLTRFSRDLMLIG
jgi:Xaa-Pro aminopeptidase